MKKPVLTLSSLLLFCFIFTSFISTKPKKFIPPGTVQISETFFADETEVSNFAWQEFEYWTKTKYGANSPEHIATLPDTLVWRHPLAYCEPYTEYYFRHPAYRQYPVVGISHEQAVEFCKWRTERVKEFWYLKTKQELNIEYRLPTKQEWELISNNGIDIFNNKDGKNKKGERVLNCTWAADTAGTMIDNADVTAPIYSYWKNWFGLYNTIGNVAELTSEKGICKGGSWKHEFESCRAGKDIPYTKPEAWIGFRCVCIVKK